MEATWLPREVTGSPKPGAKVHRLFATEALVAHVRRVHAENVAHSSTWRHRYRPRADCPVDVYGRPV